MTTEKNINESSEEKIENGVPAPSLSIEDIIAKFKVAYRNFLNWKFKGGLPGFRFPYHYEPGNRDYFPEEEKEYKKFEELLPKIEYPSVDMNEIKRKIEDEVRQEVIARITKDAEETAKVIQALIDENDSKGE